MYEEWFENIAAEYFKRDIRVVLTWLCKLFNQYLWEGYTPLYWRRSVFMSLYKGQRAKGNAWNVDTIG